MNSYAIQQVADKAYCEATLYPAELKANVGANIENQRIAITISDHVDPTAVFVQTHRGGWFEMTGNTGQRKRGYGVAHAYVVDATATAIVPA